MSHRLDSGRAAASVIVGLSAGVEVNLLINPPFGVGIGVAVLASAGMAWLLTWR